MKGVFPFISGEKSTLILGGKIGLKGVFPFISRENPFFKVCI